MPFQIVKSNRRLPSVDVLVQFRQAATALAQGERSQTDPEFGRVTDIRVIPSSKEGTPNSFLYGTYEAATQEDVAACYRDIFKRICQHGWTSVAVPLCPSRLPSQEVYWIACAEIRRILAEQELQIVLILDSVKTLRPAAELFQIVKDYIGQHFTGPETTHALTLKAKRARSGDSACGGAAVKPKLLPREEERASEYPDRNGGDSFFSEDAKGIPDQLEADGKEAAYSRKRNYKLRNLLDEPQPEYDPFDAILIQFSVSDEEGAFTRFNPQAGTIRLDESFSQAVLRLIEEKGLTDPQCYNRANLSRAVFNKLKQSALNPEKVSYKPSKSTALALAVALELNLDEAEELLQKAGFAISHSSKGDIIVEYFLANHLYDIFELNEVLFKFGEPLLGSL